MAVSTSTKFSPGGVINVPQVVSEFNKYEASATPRYAVGFKVEDGEGNVYRYSHFGATTTRGLVVAQDISESGRAESENYIVASASAQTVTDGLIGSRYVEIDEATDVTADQYRGGKFITVDDTGEGYTYDIVGNTACDDPATGNFRLELKQKLQSAVTSDTDYMIIGSKYANLEAATSATDNILAGVSCAAMTVTTACYGWVQTKGICGVLTTTPVPSIGDNVIVSGTGAVCAANALATLQNNQIVGVCVVDGDTTGHSAIAIDLE